MRLRVKKIEGRADDGFLYVANMYKPRVSFRQQLFLAMGY